MCQILLSINPQYVESILEGTKRFEYRKRKCNRNDVDKIIIYATAPIKAIVGEVEIEDVLINTPEELWKETSKYSGVSKKFFDSYYKGKDLAVAYKLGKVRKYDKPRTLHEYGIKCAPQSFVYLS